MKILHIAYISSEFPPDTGNGGIGTYTWQIAKIMTERKHNVEVFAASETREISEKYDNITTHRIKVKRLVDFKKFVVSKFSEIHRQNKFDIVECPEIGGEAEFIKNEFPHNRFLFWYTVYKSQFRSW